MAGHRASIRLRLTLGLGAAGLLALAPAARADVFAVATVKAPAPRTDLDIALINANLGSRSALPASVNTTADEIHPSITSDGKRLVFQRRDLAAGTVRIVVVDLGTGQAADLFTGFEVATRAPDGAAITPNGQTVATGGPFVPATGQNSFFSDLTLTDVRGFPTAPFPRGLLRPQYSFVENGQVASPVAGGNNLFAYVETRAGFNGELVLSQLGATSSLPQARANETYDNPAIAATSPQFVLFDSRPVTNGVAGTGDIVFRPANTSTFVGTPTKLPAIVNSALDESQPSLTPNGRYVSFVRHGNDGHDRLFVWDSSTQLILNANGADLGVVTTRDVGGVSTFERALLPLTAVTANNLITARLLRNADVGIIVQRVTGFRRIFGLRRPVLQLVGRVPFGPQRAGRVSVRWNGRVNGRLQPPGLYQITVRALSARGLVRDFGRPTLVRIGREGAITRVVRRVGR